MIAVLFAAQGAIAQTKKVHFVGNSFTATFDVPAVVEALSASGGHTVQTTKDIIGGAKLELHWSTGTATNSIANGNFDYVVLQEGSSLSYKPETEASYLIYAPLFDQQITNSGAQTMLYMTWPPESHIDAMDHGIAIHRDMAAQLGSQIAPAGEAWRRLLEQSIYIDPYGGDRHHQSEAGTYLNACSFYGALFNESPEGLPMHTVGGFILDDADAALLQRIAWDAVNFVSYTNPPVIVSMTVDQAVRSDTTPFAFQAAASDNGSIADYLWDFGDGTTTNGAALTNVSHTYATDGVFPVTVKVTDNSGETERTGLYATRDTIGPQVVAITAQSSTVTVQFNQDMQQTSAEVAANYTIDGNVSVLSATQIAPDTVRLDVSPVSAGVNYVLTLNNLVSSLGMTILPNTLGNFTYVDGSNLHLRFDFGSTNYPTAGNWNNVMQWGGDLVISNAVDIYGVSRSIGLRCVPSTSANFSRISFGTVDVTLYPDTAQRDYVRYGLNYSYQLEGLDPASTYRLTLFASRTKDPSATLYTVGSSNIVLDTALNTDRTAVFENLQADANGNILFTVKKSVGTWGCLSVMTLEDTSSAAPGIETSVSTLDIDEGTTNSFQIRLSSQPSENVTVSANNVSGEPHIQVLSGSSFTTFTTNDWNIWKLIYVEALTDVDSINGVATIECADLDGTYTLADVTATQIDSTPPPASPPVAIDQNVTTSQDTAINLVLTATDVDSMNLTYAIVAGPTSGSLRVLDANTGAVTYTPTSGYSGAGSFTFSAFDGALYATGTVSITVSVALQESSASILFDFGSTNYPTSGNWNNVMYFGGDLVITNAIDADGLSTSVGLRFASSVAMSYTKTSYGTVDSTLYPATAQRDCLRYGNPYSYQIEGLNTGATYRLTFFGSRTKTPSETLYTVGTSNEVLDCAYNTDRTAVFDGVQPDASGHILFTVERNATNGGSFAYISALELEILSGVTADIDGDGLPDSWEAQYFGGATNANPDAIAANGVNTLLETYIAGLDPTNAFSFATVSGQSTPAQTLLEWNAVSGRVYSVSWTTNLINGFQLVATNIVYPQNSWTDQVHSVENNGFYKINVKLQ